eukprot:Colp12_sorted_trinity150504_noHs@2879
MATPKLPQSPVGDGKDALSPEKFFTSLINTNIEGFKRITAFAKSSSTPSSSALGKTTQWKRHYRSPGSMKPVYGAQYPPPLDLSSPKEPSSPVSTERRSDGTGSPIISRLTSRKSTRKSFDEFNSETDDVWTEADDDIGSVPKSLPDKRPVSFTDDGEIYEEDIPDAIIEESRRKVTSAESERDQSRIERFNKILEQPKIDMDALKKLSWSGIPSKLRTVVWRVLSGYLPASSDRRGVTLERKRDEYRQFIKQYYTPKQIEQNHALHHQIEIDLPRTNRKVPLFQQKIVQEILLRILHIWAIRHPASGYVQGMNDLVTPFLVVFLKSFIGDEDPETYEVSQLSEEVVSDIEADTFWCTSKLLDSIQDNYTFAQIGIQRKVRNLEDLVQRIDVRLHEHLIKHNINYLQVTFRWMNCLLMRELPLSCIVRIWDTYQAEGENFGTFHLYVCAAFLVRWSDQLREKEDFQDIMLFLQNLPTDDWTDKDIELLLSEAYMWKTLFQDSPSHLQSAAQS